MTSAWLMMAMLAAGPAETAKEQGAPAPRRSELADALRTMSAVIDAVVAADARTRGHGDAPLRLADALARGSASTEDVAVITRWVLEAKEEDVARELADVLGTAGLAGRGPQARRWNPVMGAMVALMRSALSDAAQHRRRDVGDWAELHALVKAAAPAVAASLQEADPETREQLKLLLGAAMEGLSEVGAKAHR
jgi:hypothetical protein